ncbi:hypothetical protein [Leucobacter luti]|uniref:Acetoin utilization deacetylase AcuC-like enzyme n=1 Tax=Leucobacter luti TaxID=340320 RepID=A0A4Q7TSG6_9MICO|nr:hypothetical protein [Leucobacter luti]MBL3699821.1 hypothetical protein [Leucobacter luti]RZT62860.1 acetoin utilization deacetylase AcuC-like enzyme [Leucobacter luti]
MGHDELLRVHFDARVLDHDTGVALHEAAPSPWFAAHEPHTEGRLRIERMHDILARGPVADAIRLAPGRLAEEDELAAVHDPGYVAELRRTIERGGGWVTPTTRLSANSYDPLRAAAGTALAAAETVLSGAAPFAYALTRPPGHHAQRAQADGYCFFNGAALAADAARRAGIERVLVIDWDVHHGNGTQDIFYERDDVLTVSLHMDHGAWGESHRQTGGLEERGVGRGVGFNQNIPLPLGVGNAAYLRAFDEVIAPLAERFAPGMIVCASGQDASAYDPNGRHNVSMPGFYGIGARVRALADRHAEGRAILIQEGGYNPSYAPYCLLATIEGLLGVEGTGDPLAYVPDQTLGVAEILAEVVAAQAAAGPAPA